MVFNIENSPSLCPIKLKKSICWYKLLIPFRSLVHIFLKPPIFFTMENELNKIININKHDHSWIHKQKRKRNLKFQGLFYRLQCFSDANDVILKFDWIWTNKKLYIVESNNRITINNFYLLNLRIIDIHLLCLICCCCNGG